MTTPPPAELPAPPAALGRLGPALARLAAAQGAWPPVAPATVVAAPEVEGLAAGEAAGDALVDAGADLVLVQGGDTGTGTLAALALLLDLEPVAVVGTAGGPGWAAQVAAVRDGLRAARPSRGDVAAQLKAAGAPGVLGLAALLAQCARRRTPALLSGAPDACAAALAAERLAPGTGAWLTAGCSPASPAAADALRRARLEPLLDLRLDDPGTARLALGVLLGGADIARG